MDIDRILAAQKAWQAVLMEDETAIRNMIAESLTRCADAIAVLRHNLREIGYVWTSTEKISPNELSGNIVTIEKTIGEPIPKILSMFWEIVGGVSFVDLEKYRHVSFWKAHKITAPDDFCDGLYVDPCNKEWTSFICDDFIDWKEYGMEKESDQFLISLSPDGYHKDNISGGESYGVYPGASWRPIWENFEWSGRMRPLTTPAGPPDFLSYLRTALLECAGFPGFLGTPGFDPIKERLLQGVPVF